MKNQILFLSLFILILPHYILGQPSSKKYKKEIKKHRKVYTKKLIENNIVPKKDKKKVTFFESSLDYKVKAAFQKGTGEKLKFMTSSGIEKEFLHYGILQFKINEEEQELTVYRSVRNMRMPQYKDYLFLPFKDKTSDASTYGGGRYIDLKIGQLNKDEIWIDFNKAYNPYCAFKDGFSCPIPPKENHLDISITAGEASFKKH